MKAGGLSGMVSHNFGKGDFLKAVSQARPAKGEKRT